MLNALLVPVVRSYLERLERRLGEDGFSPAVFLVQSNGGVCGLRRAAEQPARLLLSGPSGGALAAERLAQLLDRPNLVGVDMGGTSYDVSVVLGGRVSIITQGEVDRLPVRLPMVEMRTIGAGGGSIAAVESGRLTVGPRSAGAQARSGRLWQGRDGADGDRRQPGAGPAGPGVFPGRQHGAGHGCDTGRHHIADCPAPSPGGRRGGRGNSPRRR